MVSFLFILEITTYMEVVGVEAGQVPVTGHRELPC
jgi:hypothetical protein